MSDEIEKKENSKRMLSIGIRLPLPIFMQIDVEAKAEMIQPGQVARRIIVRHYQQTAGGKPVETF